MLRGDLDAPLDLRERALSLAGAVLEMHPPTCTPLPARARVLTIDASVVHAAPIIATWICENVCDPVIVGPDSESAQWTRAVAELAAAPWFVAEKSRRGDDDVRVTLPRFDALVGRTPVLVDDMIATGATMAETIRQLLDRGCPAPACVAIHAVFVDSAEVALRDAGAAARRGRGGARGRDVMREQRFSIRTGRRLECRRAAVGA